MKIKFVEIKNFRKLKSCHIAFSERETVFVGANNGGKSVSDFLAQHSANVMKSKWRSG